MVCRGRDGNAVGLSLPWPSSLGDDNVLALVGQDSSEGGNLGGEEASRVSSNGATIEEGVAVDGAKVGAVAKLRVVARCDEGVNSHDLSRVAGGLEKGSGSDNSSTDLTCRSSAIIDKLITDVDSVNEVPSIASS